MKILIMAGGRDGKRTIALNGNRPRRAGVQGCTPRAVQEVRSRAMDGEDSL